jgi:hypothetical protein
MPVSMRPPPSNLREEVPGHTLLALSAGAHIRASVGAEVDGLAAWAPGGHSYRGGTWNSSNVTAALSTK